MTFSDIQNHIHTIAPFDAAEEWDNVGLLVGSPATEATGILVALDATTDAIHAAVKAGANLLVTHHPVIFEPLRRLEADSLPYRLAAAGVGLLAAHTNLDKATGGVNDTLAELLGLTDVTPAADGLCRIGRLSAPMEPAAFARLVAQRLDTPVRLGGNRPVSTVAVCGGSGGDFIEELCPVADAYVTGEVKHHQWLAANEAGLTLVEAGHYATEVPVVAALCDRLREAFPALPIIPYYEEPYTTLK
ncbi:MAG: Nif3-like dinuclear metal center hexameric protein [Clostridia bacterium]|nr:Nif3-like dinuclear metal center hexameric protein [Clostridia bacterium]